MTQPLVLTLPWACLVSDNQKYGVMRGRKVLTKAYRAGLEAATLHVKRQVRLRDRITGPCHVELTFHEPNRSRVRDIWNYGKLIADALKERAITDDGNIDDSRIRRGEVRGKAACVVITITPLGQQEEAA